MKKAIFILLLAGCSQVEPESTKISSSVESYKTFASYMDISPELTGIDENTDGIRDDLKRYVQETIPSNISFYSLSYLTALQKLITYQGPEFDGSQASKVINPSIGINEKQILLSPRFKEAQEFIRLGWCLNKEASVNGLNQRDFSKELLKASINTEARVKAFVRYQPYFARVKEPKKGWKCEKLTTNE